MPECTPAVDSATSPTGASGPCAVAYPLDEFYQRRGLHLPPLEVVDAASVPEPYHGLLVHERDMTSTLEAFHQDRVHLRPGSGAGFGQERNARGVRGHPHQFAALSGASSGRHPGGTFSTRPHSQRVLHRVCQPAKTFSAARLGQDHQPVAGFERGPLPLRTAE